VSPAPEIASPLDGALGHVLVEVADGVATLRLTPAPLAVGSEEPPFLHGGTLSTCIDTAAWYAACSAGGGDWVVSGLAADFLRPARIEVHRVTARCRRAGRAVAVVDVEIAPWDEPERLVALGRATLSRL
jgi:uncharacterized protein (TIGR00369 family)